MSGTKQVKVDNWGIYFLQRLKHFFNRTDYCDLTLQFQDNAQLKVHRLVISACTEYFELLERTCEMYEDCLVMPDDLQADVVVPIVNFMYTGKLEFRQELLEKLYQTSLVMNMPVLSKLLDAHRHEPRLPVRQNMPVHSYSKYSKSEIRQMNPVASSSGTPMKRGFTKSFESSNSYDNSKAYDNEPKHKKPHLILPNKTEPIQLIEHEQQSIDTTYNFPVISERNKHLSLEPRPTRYELPEELDVDNIFDNSFTSISYTSKPLMVHPEARKQYGAKKAHLFEDASGSQRLFKCSPSDVVECRKISMNNSNLFDEDIPFGDSFENEIATKKQEPKDASQLFDQIIVNSGSSLAIETKDIKESGNIDHAKIISEVLKKYPHLVKGNKNIKLKILNTTNKQKKKRLQPLMATPEKEVKPKLELPDFTYETDVFDSKEAARLIAMGAENVKGPWICLLCGTPGRALHFTSYYKFRRHLVDIHNEKPVPTICEYCGLKSPKRNYLVHHLYTKHGVEPPPSYNFPKCNYCNYIALTEGFLIKHKRTHIEYKSFRCYVCASTFGTSQQLLVHIQRTGHKYTADRKTNLQCIYCLKMFLREANLYTHLKTTHKQCAKSDGILDDSDEEKYEYEEIMQQNECQKSKQEIKLDRSLLEFDVPVNVENDSYEDSEYHIEHKSFGNIQVSKKPKILLPKRKLLNTDFNTQNQTVQSIPKKKVHQEIPKRNDFIQEIDTRQPNENEEIIVIDNNEYVIENYQLVPKREKMTEDFKPETIIPDMEEAMTTLASDTSLHYQTIQNAHPESSRMIINKNTSINQPIQIVVSNEEEYKALMASNHSIIFDDGDANKTLRVLAAQNNAPIETNSIDLQNTQSNEMMIMPENYPMSVAETVSADNSNIVVVYSHPLDDQNKQFQLMTSQGIEAQFVQPSTMITQNFETVTTCSPVMNSNAINTPIHVSSTEETWQNNINENIDKLPVSASAELQTITAPIESVLCNSLNDLPQIQLTTTKELPVEINQQSDLSSNENGNNIIVYTQHEEIQHQQHANMLHDQSEQLINQQEQNENISVSESHSNIVSSLHLLDQTVTTAHIQSHHNVIIDSSPQMQTSELPPNETLCQTIVDNTDNGNTVTNNTDINLEGSDLEPIHEENVHTTISETLVHYEEVPNEMVENNIQEDQSEESDKDLSQPTAIPTSVIVEEHLTINNQSIKEQNLETVTDTNISVESHETEIDTSMSVVTHETEINKNMSDETEMNTNMCVETHVTEIDTNMCVETHETEIDTNISVEVQDSEIIEKMAEDGGVDYSIEQNKQNDHVLENAGTPISSESQQDSPQNSPKACSKEHIKILTSEWSEDEIEAPQEVITETPSHAAETPASPEEESIEKIQQEINRQIATSDLNTSKKDENECEQVEEKSSSQSKSSLEKISSLLNDWDDNDSQEEDVNTTEESDKTKGDTESAAQVEVASEKSEVDNGEKDNAILKDDNIKSLVSDWDEEEEQEIKD